MVNIVKILSFIRNNPGALIAGVVIIALLSVGLYGNNQRKKKNKLQAEVDFLKADSTKKYLEILTLRHDTSFYIREFKVTNSRLDSLISIDAKLNPKLARELPSIDKIKRR